jgi:hypothetical protein
VPVTLLDRNSDELDGLEHDLLDECVAMVRYAGLCGVELPGEALSAAAVAWHRVRGPRHDHDHDPERLPLLTVAHRQLARALAPASARIAVLNYRAATSNKGFRLLGIFPLTRGLAAVGLLSLFALVGTHLAQRWSGASIPWNAASVMISAVLAAAAGASFMTLIQVGRDSVDRSFDPSRPFPYLALFSTTFAAGTVGSAVVLGLLHTSVARPADAALLAFTGAVLIGWLIRSTSKVVATLLSRRNTASEPEPVEGDIESRVDLVRALLAVQRQLATGTRLSTIRRELARIVERMPATTAFRESEHRSLSPSSRVEPKDPE